MVEPKGARANSWEDVADLSARAGIVLDSWQELILQASMGERSDATWAAKRVGVSLGRQNGKSQLLVARALAGALLFGEKKIVISAHQADTARETFGKFIEIHDDDANGWLRDRVKPNGIMYAINREAIKFKNGATIQFKARTGSGGRGFSSDCLMLDEAQRLKRAAWVSINSTMSAMPNPQVWLLGTPPTPEDYEAGMGDVFESIRDSAIASTATSTAWCEWGADPTSPEFAEAMRPRPCEWTSGVESACWSANPAWNARINLDVVQGEFESYTPEEFAQDRLGVWLKDVGGTSGTRAIAADMWSDSGVMAKPDGAPSFAVAFSFKGDRVSVGAAVKHDNGVHVELIDIGDSTDSGLGILADWLSERKRDVATFVFSGSSSAGLLKRLMVDRGVSERKIKIATTSQYLQACAMFRDALLEGTVTHLASDGQAVLNESIEITDVDKRGGWVATTPDGDETPVEAISLALWGSRTSKHRSGAAVFR